jgi:hypothetical protein
VLGQQSWFKNELTEGVVDMTLGVSLSLQSTHICTSDETTRSSEFALTSGCSLIIHLEFALTNVYKKFLWSMKPTVRVLYF